MKQIDIDRMVDARNMSPEHKNILRRALGYAAGDGRKEIQEKLDSLDKEVGNILSNLGSTLGAVSLEIGNDEGDKERNLAKLKTLNGIAKANIKTINGVAIANVKSINGIV